MKLKDYRLELEPQWVEECVLLAVDRLSHDVERSFRVERDVVYEIEEEEVRESRFRTFHARWFEKLHLSDGVLQCLEEFPFVVEGTSRCVALPAVTAAEESADLHEDRQPEPPMEAAKPVLVMRLRPPTLLNAEQLADRLRHELSHVTDMLDPQFGYQKHLRSFSPELDPAFESLFRNRYRVLWDTTIDGRLAARGVLPPNVESMRKHDFLNVFPMLEDRAEECFQHFFLCLHPHHDELVRFATQPGSPLE
jgi:hypothetical protein